MAKKKKARKVRVYELPKLNIKAEHLVLACDPGSANFGIALVGLNKGRVKIYANAVLMEPLNDLVEFNKKSTSFVQEFDTWMTYAPGGIVAERFQTRGLSGPVIEQVSAMLGIMRGRYKVPVKLTIASVWKNRVQRRFDIDLKEVYEASSVQPHQIDAALIGVFGLEEGLQRTLDYTVEDVVRQVEATSLIGHKGDKHPKKERS